MKRFIRIIFGISLIIAGCASPVSSATLLGDVTENGSVTAIDATYVLQYLCGSRSLSAQALINAEVSGDGIVTEIDAQLILIKAADSGFVFPIEE